MKWLILYSNEGKSDFKKVSKYLRKYNMDFVFLEDTEKYKNLEDEKKLIKNMTKISQLLRGVTHVMCLNVQILPLKSLYLYALGFLSHPKVSVFYTGENPLGTEEVLKPLFPSCVDINSLFENLDESFSDFIKSEREQRAKQELANKKIAINNDVFAQAIIDEDLRIAELLFSVGIDVNATDSEGTPMLSLAVRNDSLLMVKWLIGKKANINAVSEDRGYTPLMDAVWKNKLNIVKYLIDMGADANTTCKDGQPIAVIASGVGNLDICKLLFEKGSDIYKKDAMGMSAFDYATLFSNKKLLEVYNAGKE